MKIENNKYYFIGILWLICGYLSWVIAVYSFSYGTVNLQPTIYKYIKTLHSYFIWNLTSFVLFHITDFLFAFILTAVLSRATGKKKIWIVFFIAGAIIRPLYETIRSHIINLNSYETLPSWASTSFAESIIAYLIVLPLIAWTGAIIGNKYRREKTA